MTRTKKQNNFYAWLIILLPILSNYTIGPLDLDVAVVLLASLVYLLFHRIIYVTPMARRVFIIVLYIAGISLVNILFGVKYAYTKDIIMRTVKYCLYLILLFFCFNEYLNYENVIKVFRIVVYLATAYILVQAVFFYGAGITLPNRIGGTTSNAEVEYGRLRSFYSEPAALAYSIVPFVACSLFGPQNGTAGKKGYLDAIVASSCVLISTSGQGIVCVAFLWGAWILLRLINRQMKVRDFMLILGIAGVAILLYKSGILKFAVERITNTGEHTTTEVRASGYRTLSLLSPLQLIFGTGYGNHIVESVLETGDLFQTLNYSTLAQFLFSLGIVGTLLFVSFFASVFRRGNLCVRLIIIVFIILSIGGAPSLPIVFPIWLTMMCVQLPQGQFSGKATYEPEQT